jgi:[protein-PII] uridylyltransferase
VPPSVEISNDESDFYTVVDVTTNDRPALLYDITRTLADHGLNVVVSRASTRAHRATDAFYVTEDGHKLTDPKRRQALRDSLLQAIHRGGS